MTDHTEDPDLEPLRALFRDAWRQQTSGLSGRHAAHRSAEALNEKIATMEGKGSHAPALGDRQASTSEKFVGLGVRRVSGVGTRTLQRILWSAGAAVAVLLTVALMSYKRSASSETTHTYTTLSGQQATFTLTDGTRVTLAPRTTLRLIRFGSMSRTVALDGQAYFEVAHAEGTPFLVRTGSITAQVLGTTFIVRHYANDEKVHVAVSTGKVKIVPNAPARWPRAMPFMLTNGHAGDVTDSTVLVNTVDLTSETDWLRGRLVFRHTPVVEVLQTLSRWYGYQFRCDDSTLTQVRVTLALNARSSAEALSTLEQILSVHLTIVGDTVTLTPHARWVPKGAVRKQVYDIWVPTREVGR